MHRHMLDARWAYHHTDPPGVGLKWPQYCDPPVTVYIRMAIWSWRIAATLVACVAETPRLGIDCEFRRQVMVLFLRLPLSSCVVRLTSSLCYCQYSCNLYSPPQYTYRWAPFCLCCSNAIIPYMKEIVLCLLLELKPRLFQEQKSFTCNWNV